MYNMTKEDAKKILADLIDNPFLHTWEEQNKALHMAIESLSVNNENVNLIKPSGDSILRSDAKDKAKEIIYSILDDTNYDDIESMAHACMMMKIKVLKMFDEFPSADGVSYEDFEPVDNKLYLNPVCRNCKHSSYCNNIPTDENNEDIEHYDAYGRPVLSVRECKNYEPESN